MLASGSRASAGQRLVSRCKLAATIPRVPFRPMATAAATTSAAAPPTAKPPSTANDQSIKIVLSKPAGPEDKTNDRKTLGRLLNTLRTNSRHIAFIDTPADDINAIRRTARLFAQASMILAQEQPDKVLEVLIASRPDRKPAAKAAAGAAAAPKARAGKLRVTAVLKHGPQHPATPVAPSGAAAPGNEMVKVNSKTEVNKLAAVLVSRVQDQGQAKIAAVGLPALASAIKAIAMCRNIVAKQNNKNVSAYLSIDKVGDEAEGSWGKITTITLRPSERNIPYKPRDLPVANA